MHTREGWTNALLFKTFRERRLTEFVLAVQKLIGIQGTGMKYIISPGNRIVPN